MRTKRSSEAVQAEQIQGSLQAQDPAQATQSDRFQVNPNSHSRSRQSKPTNIFNGLSDRRKQSLNQPSDSSNANMFNKMTGAHLVEPDPSSREGSIIGDGTSHKQLPPAEMTA